MTKPLKRLAVEGVIWAGGQAMISKVVGVFSQIVLAWILTPSDFGLVAMCNSVMALVSVVQSGGIRSILIQRQKNIGLWSAPAFWFSIFLGTLAAMLVLLSIPIAVRYYDQPLLWSLMPIMAAGVIMDSVAVVPTAHLQSELKFRVLGLANVLMPVSQALISIALAKLGFGAFSLILPKIPVGFAVFCFLYWQSSFRISWKTHVQRWRYIAADSFLVLGAWLSFAIANQVPLIVLGRMRGATVVGIYAFASLFTTQVITLFTAQLDGVLFPTLSRLKDNPDLQWQAFSKVTRILALCVFALNGLQYAIADPLIRIVFADRWHAAIPYIKLLSLGNAMLAAAIPTGSLLQASGRFRAYFVFASCSAAIALAVVLLGCLVIPSDLGVAYGAVTYQVIVSLLAWKTSAVLLRGDFRSLVKELTTPFAASFVSAMIANRLDGWVRFHNPWLNIVIVATAYAVSCGAVLAIFWRTSLMEVIGQIRSLFYAKKIT